ncbi:MAG: tryptophanyl-tRNA synthetase [Alphaproteobacteria bacterium]|jgi:tryptophanyl-tRNA synthetase|nr:tryptophanyl-tRNA synthetase [Alphaproteobacteria bacterium]
MKRVLSGIRPTGDIHLGNYLGAIQNWILMQDQMDENLFCIVDLHALTTLEDVKNLVGNTRIMAAAYIASGINPDQSTIFVQSHVPAHTELSWILSCITPMGWLNRMTQFKEKAGKQRENACLGLLAYPVLMAADILIYKATHVPVGDDQKQHLEFTRDIAGMFNREFKKDIFPLPDPIIKGPATRIMSLRDGTAKMSKSDTSDYSRINLMDDVDTLALKIRKAKTDADPLPAQVKDLEARPEAHNLVNIYAALSGQTADQVCKTFAGSYFSTFKKDLTDLVVAKISPIGQEMQRLLKDKGELDQVLSRGSMRANTLAETHMQEVRDIVGLLKPDEGVNRTRQMDVLKSIA